jgi:hypothetical protein
LIISDLDETVLLKHACASKGSKKSLGRSSTAHVQKIGHILPSKALVDQLSRVVDLLGREFSFRSKLRAS